MGDAGADEVGAMAQARERLAELHAQLPERVADEVLQLPALHQPPEPLRRIQIRRVAGEALEVEPLRAARAQAGPDGLAVVDRGPSQSTSSSPGRCRRRWRRKRTTIHPGQRPVLAPPAEDPPARG